MTFLIVLYWKKLLFAFFSSNIKEVIRAVLKFLLSFYEKISHAQKSTKSTKEHKKAQKRNQTKGQNANKRTKIKNVLKKHQRGKSSLFVYLRFCACEEKKYKSLSNGNVGPTKLVKVLSALYEQKLGY